MKTRNLLLAMTLPTLFAACTAEEIIQAENNVLDNRALLGDLTAQVENPVASRVSWSDTDLAWGAWEATDAFGSALVDPTTFGTVEDKMLTNYVWKQNASGAWNTTSQLVEGTYSFYSYKGVSKKNNRDLVKFDITAQTSDLDNPTKVIDDNQLFFSPLYMIDDKNANEENNIALPLKFYPYFAVGAYKMTNQTGQDLLISQVIAEGKFNAKGEIQPTLIEAADLVYSVRKDESEYKLPMKSATAEYTADEIKKAWMTSDLDNAEEAKTIAMNTNNWKWEDGEEIMIYMAIPANSQIKVVKVNVVDEEGEARFFQVEETKQPLKIHYETIASANMEDQEFKRSMPVSVFGKLSSGAPKGISVEEDNLAPADGFYIDNETALEELINNSRGNILVYNFGGLQVTKNVADILTEYTAGIVTFQNDIEVEDTEEVVMNNITFAGEVTVKEGTTAVFNDITAEEKLTIEAGANVTLKGGSYANVINNGTLKVEKTAGSISKITTNYDLTIVGADRTIELNKGNLTYKPVDADTDYTVVLPKLKSTITEDYTITIEDGVTMNVENNLPSTTIYAEDVASAKFVNKGVLNFAGSANLYDVENSGKINVNGAYLSIFGEADNSGEIAGTLVAFAEGSSTTNSGKISAKARVMGEMSMTSTGRLQLEGNDLSTGRVDNTNAGRIYGASNEDYLTIYHLFENGCDLEDLAAVKATQYSINTLVVKGTFNWVDVDGLDLSNIANVDNIEFEDAILDIDADTEAKIYTSDVKVRGNVVIRGWNDSSDIKFMEATTVELAAGATLTIQDCEVANTSMDVTINATYATSTSKATFTKDQATVKDSGNHIKPANPATAAGKYLVVKNAL